MKKAGIKAVILLQGAVVIYSLTTVIGKLVSQHEFLSAGWILLYLLDFAVLGLYALLWQQLLKRFELSVAYANKAMTLFWSLLWSVVLFSEGITVKKVVGVLLVVLGTVVLNSGKGGE